MLLPISKLGIGLGVFAALSSVTYVVIYLSKNTIKSLHDTGESFGSSRTNLKFGDEFSYYFLSTKDNLNAKKWKERAKLLRENKPQGNLDHFFTDIKDKADEKSIREICKQKYGEDFQLEESGKAKWKGMWVYCSIGGTRPKIIGRSSHNDEAKYKTGEQDSFGKALKDKLISTKDPLNQWFWELRQKEFKDGKLKTNPESTYFTTNTTETIKVLCERAYGMQSSETPTTTQPSKTEVERYCSIGKIDLQD